MEIQQVSVDSLIPYEFNNVKHPDSQVDRIANSIQEFGFNVPIIVNGENIIISGHGRLLAAKKLGLTEVPVVRKDTLTAAQEKQLRILDNKITRDSEWDFENLGLEFDVLKDEGFDLTEWGLEKFLPAISDNILNSAAEEESKAVKDEKQFLVVLHCDSEAKQQELYDEMQERGIQCKLVT